MPARYRLPGWATALLFVAFPVVSFPFALGSRSDQPAIVDL